LFVLTFILSLPRTTHFYYWYS